MNGEGHPQPRGDVAVASQTGAAFNQVLDRAWDRTLKAMENGSVEFHTEGDLRAYLYHECARQLEEHGYSSPLPLHAESTIGRSKADLTLGADREVVVELKYEPYTSENGSLFVFEREGSHNIEKDVKKLRTYAAGGRVAHLIVVEKRYRDGAVYFPDLTAKLGIPRARWTVGDRYAWTHLVTQPPQQGRGL